MSDLLNPTTSALLQVELIQDQLDRLDPDLAVRVVLAGVSLNLNKIVKELSLANQIMLVRYMEKEKNGNKPFTEAEQKRLDELQAMFMKSYTHKDSVPN